MFRKEALDDFLRYGDWANDRLLEAAGAMTDAQLDQPFDIGMGTLRRTLIHIWAGERTWLQRWQGRTETGWPNETESEDVSHLREKFHAVRTERDAFLSSLRPEMLAALVTYRDSKGSLFKATLSDMLMQGVVHSIHHRAQAANLLRRSAGQLVDLDYMYWIRQPA